MQQREKPVGILNSPTFLKLLQALLEITLGSTCCQGKKYECE